MTNQTNQKEFKRGGFYWIEDKPFVSVTNILKIIDKPALRRWVGKEVYLAMVKDPTISEAEALSAPYKKSEKASLRGKAIHCAHDDDDGDLVHAVFNMSLAGRGD